MERVYRYGRQPGYNRLAGPGQAGLERLELGVVRVPQEGEYRFDLGGREAVLVLLSGACAVEVDGESWSLERVSAFAEPPIAAFVPRHRRYTVTATKPADLAVFTAEATRDYLPRMIGRDLIAEQMEGAGGFRRRVYTIVGQNFSASRLLVGETHVLPGQWSSYPPHKHDEDDYPQEVQLEEIALFQIDPPQGFALQYLYSADRSLDEAHVVRNDEAVVAKRGYHPVAVPPGYHVSYLWGMAGDGHVLRSSHDPAHAWVAQETGAPEPVSVPG